MKYFAPNSEILGNTQLKLLRFNPSSSFLLFKNFCIGFPLMHMDEMIYEMNYILNRGYEIK